ncbi:MAG: DNA-binding response regulator [Pyrinomonas sp.]|uniref:response regulator transcription factor n=1 Tax=Pyrinomonas sp. TaxID=2080306 RepID=UPI0033168DB6
MGKDKPIRILVADDHFVVRMGLAALINTQPDMTVVAEATNGKEAVELFRRHRPDIALLDLRMPEMNGIEAIAAIRNEFPDARLVVLSSYDGDEDIYRALQAGARGYLLKNMLREGVLETIRTVHAGLRRIPEDIAARLAERMSRDPLTPREIEVLELIVRGKSNKEIAYALKITEGTVKIHVNNILNKLGVADRTQAAIFALKHGLVHLE